MKTFVAISDDENRVASELEEILIKIFNDLDIKYEIDVYYSGDNLYKSMESSKKHYDKETLLIKSENPYNGVIKYKDEEKSEICSLKQGDSHGYGLKNIRKAVEKYNGDFHISIEDNVFSVSIVLF